VPPLPRRILQTLRERRLLPAGARVLVAVSGGLDSMVLLHMLAGLAQEQRWQLAVAHLNHRLRGRCSDADQRLVERTARKLGLRCCGGSREVRELARQRKVSLEMAARESRHDFLARTARELGCAQIALAHHADDQVELFFLRLLRGAGSDGLAGMDWSSPSPADPAITLIRPLLGSRKAELAEWARAAGIVFREDASNADPSMLRNRIRHRLLPLLRQEFQPALETVVGRVMASLAGEADLVADHAARWLKSGRPAFRRLPVAVQRRCLAGELRRLGCEPDFALLEQLRLHPETPVTIRPGLRLRRVAGPHEQRAGNLLTTDRAAPKAATEVGSPRAQAVLRLKQDGKEQRVNFGRGRLSLRELAGRRLPARQPGTEHFDADVIGPRIVLRHWRAGDRFQPIGLPAAAKLQDLFTNAKVPRAERHERVVAEAADGRVFWVEGLRIGDAFKVTPATRRRLRWTWNR
jgi:tRNA(Ile)-lysidine synthase